MCTISAWVISVIHIRVSHPFFRHNLLTMAITCSPPQHPLSAPLPNSPSALYAVRICSPSHRVIIRSLWRYHPLSAPLSSALRAVIIRSLHRYHLLSALLSSAPRADIIRFRFWFAWLGFIKRQSGATGTTSGLDHGHGDDGFSKTGMNPCPCNKIHISMTSLREFATFPKKITISQNERQNGAMGATSGFKIATYCEVTVSTYSQPSTYDM